MNYATRLRAALTRHFVTVFLRERGESRPTESTLVAAAICVICVEESQVRERSRVSLGLVICRIWLSGKLIPSASALFRPPHEACPMSIKHDYNAAIKH